ESKATIWDEMNEVFSHFDDQKREIERLEEKMAHVNPQEEQTYNDILRQYDALQHDFQAKGGYTYEATIKSVLTGLGFSEDRYHTPIHTLSSGQITCLALGNRLLVEADILILDALTNHLDIPTFIWFEQYICSYPGVVVIVSHDRY